MTRQQEAGRGLDAAAGNAYLCVARIRSSYDFLTRSEKKIADYILGHYREIAGKSAAELARLTGTGSATVVRFCRSVGFGGVSDFMTNLRQDSLAPETVCPELAFDDSPSVIKQKSLIYLKSVLRRMEHGLDAQLLEAAAKRIAAAGRVLITGDGGSGVSARNALDVFMQLNIDAQMAEDQFVQLMAISRAGAGDVVFAISSSGRTRNTLENLRLAKERGVYTIGLTGVPGSPITNYLDLVLLTNAESHEQFSDTVASRICEMSVIAILHSMISLYHLEGVRFDSAALSRLFDAKRVGKSNRISGRHGAAKEELC